MGSQEVGEILRSFRQVRYNLYILDKGYYIDSQVGGRCWQVRRYILYIVWYKLLGNIDVDIQVYM